MQTHLTDEGVAKNILHGCGQVLVKADKLQRQLGTATAELGCSCPGLAGGSPSFDLNDSETSRMGVTARRTA